VLAVDNLNLEVGRGELFGLLGPNGAGKTTTMKLLGGLLKPTDGMITIGGYDIQKDYMQVKRLIGYIPDFPFLYDRLTGGEFLSFVEDIYGLKKTEEYKAHLLRLFELDSAEHTLVEEYSHGMQKKLAFVSILLRSPQVYIIDEPMVGLDPRSTKVVKEILQDKKTHGATILISTHTLSVAEEVCDRIGIMDKGRLVAVGTMDGLRAISRAQGGLEDVFLALTE
jgi:ABC-2 type transport system ATP-binding protein